MMTNYFKIKEFWEKGLNDPIIKAYYQLMIDIAVYLGAKEKDAREEMKQVMVFEMKLAMITLPRDQKRNMSLAYNPTTLEDFPSYKGMPKSWTTYVRKLFQYDDVQVDIKESERIIVSDINFYQNLSLVLESTSKRTLANYAGWSIAYSTMAFLDLKSRGIGDKFTKVMFGIDETGPRWKDCLWSIAANSMYAKYMFDKKSKKQIEDMIGNVIN